MSSGIVKRVVSIWLPQWSVNLAERQCSTLQGQALATVEMHKNALRLHRVNAVAHAHGLQTGMALADARGIYPNLITRERTLHRERGALRALHRWSQRFTPWAAIDEDDGLTLDITGCAHLFGGEAPLLARLGAELTALGFAHHLVCADTRGAACLAARFSPAGQQIIPAGKTREHLSALSVNALGKDRFALRRLGMRTLSDVAALPRAELSKRFGIELSLRLEEAFGTRQVPVNPLQPAPVFRVRMSFPEPIGLRTDIDAALEKCLHRLCAKLADAGRGARQVALHLLGSSGERQVLRVGLARPGQSPAPIARQFAPLLDKADVGFGLDAVRVVIDAHEAYSPRQAQMDPALTASPAADEPLIDLVGRLGNRLGFDRITRPCPTQSHLPECRVRHVPFTEMRRPVDWSGNDPIDGSAGAAPIRVTAQSRPTTMAGRAPTHIQWRGQRLDIVTTRGPQRLSGEWWHHQPHLRQPRDYWQAHTSTGERLWLRCDLGHEEQRTWRVEGVLP